MGEARRKKLTSDNMLGYNQTVMKSQLDHYTESIGNKFFWTWRRLVREALWIFQGFMIRRGYWLRDLRDKIPACEHRVSWKNVGSSRPYQCVLCYDSVILKSQEIKNQEIKTPC